MSKELSRRIITSIFLISLLFLMFLYTYILIISLIIISVISWIEFNGLISKIFIKKNNKNKIYKFIYKSISLIYLSFLTYLIITSQADYLETNIIIYSILVSVMTDIGGLIVGKTIKGKKLTKVSPKKTISGSLGSFIFSLFLVPLFIDNFITLNLLELTIITLVISLVSQTGDLVISYLKRRAKVKDTSDLLPGHGGVLDRIDGIIFSIPISFIMFVNF